MNNKSARCCFAGHSQISDGNVMNEIKNMAEHLITEYGVNEFWVGNYGQFDSYAASAVRELKKSHHNIELNLVIPYLTNKVDQYKEHYYRSYDNILIADIPFNTPKKLHIIKGNEYMVDNCDFLICYIERSYGGAYKTYQYAKRKNLKIFNVVNMMSKMGL